MTQEIEPVFGEIKTQGRPVFALAELARTAATETNWHLVAVVEPDQLLFSEENDDSYALHVFLDTPDEVQLHISHEEMTPERRETAVEKLSRYETHLRGCINAINDDDSLISAWENELEHTQKFRRKNGKWEKHQPGFKEYWATMIRGEDGTGITFLLIALNIIIFFITVLAGGGWGSTEWDVLYQFGGNYTVAIQQGEYWRFLTSVFLHNGIFHLVLNMIGLFYGGLAAERILGSKRFLFMYLVSGLFASVTSYFFHDETLSVGASGAVFGVYGFLLGHYILPGADKELRKAVLMQLGVYIGLNLLNGMKEGIDNWAHIGGLASGFLIGLAWTYKNAPTESYEPVAFDFKSNIRQTRLLLLPALLVLCGAWMVQAKPAALKTYMAMMNEADYYYGKAMRAYPNAEDAAAMKKLQDSGIASWDRVIHILNEASKIEGLDSGRVALCSRFSEAAEQRRLAYRYILRAVNEQSPRYYDSVGAAVRLADSLEMRN
jgi:rhomboid protease GluP